MTDTRPSPALQAAQTRLYQLRESLGIAPVEKRPLASGTREARPDKRLAYAQLELQTRRQREAAMQGLKASDALKSSLTPQTTEIPKNHKPTSQTPAAAPLATTSTDTVKVYPSLALAILEHELAAPGRVYWLLRFLDESGQGWVEVSEARSQLTQKDSPLKVCTWRRLRQILNQGEDIFWQRDRAGRIWLAGAATVALNLAVARLTGQPVGIPVKALLGGIQAVRAQFYASFHSGRKTNNPISRETLRGITSVPERTQLVYEDVTNTTSQSNLVIGERYTQDQAHERAWQRGKAVFHFVDIKGRQGKVGREYIAWRLPNSYQGPQATRCKGRQKKINQRLVDLVMKGMRGNGREQVDKVFWPHGAAAGAAYSRNRAHDAYWPQHPTARAFELWHVLPGIRP